MTAGAFTATSQESPLLRTDWSGLWRVSLAFHWLRPSATVSWYRHSWTYWALFLYFHAKNSWTVRPCGNKNKLVQFSGRKFMELLYTIIEKVCLFNPAPEVHRYVALHLRKLPQTKSCIIRAILLWKNLSRSSTCIRHVPSVDIWNGSLIAWPVVYWGCQL